jgi:hypothetical protein
VADTNLTDPLGRQIILHERTWSVHVLKGHPDVAPLRPLAEDAIRHPLEVRQSTSDPDCRLYFCKVPRRKLYLMVVADVVKGLVKTAHLTRKIKGGPIEWSRPTR